MIVICKVSRVINTVHVVKATICSYYCIHDSDSQQVDQHNADGTFPVESRNYIPQVPRPQRAFFSEL